MKIAIDLDGTLSRYPYALRKLLHRALVRIVLTAAAGEFPPELRPNEVTRRLKQLDLLCGRDYDEIVCVEQNQKGDYCRKHGIDCCIDDSPEVIADVQQKSPGTMCLLVK